MAKITKLCIPDDLIEKVKSLNLRGMTSLERKNALRNILGETTGDNVNSLFEKSLLLKNQDTSFDKFIENIDGVSLEKKAEFREKFLENLKRKEAIIGDEELTTFADNALRKKYNIEVSDEKVLELTRLKREIKKLEEIAEKTPEYSPERLEMGRKMWDYKETLEGIDDAGGFIPTLKKTINESIQKISTKKTILGKTTETIKESVKKTLSIPFKNLKAAWDASYAFRQGFRILLAKGGGSIWLKQMGNTWDVWKVVGSKSKMKEVAREFYAGIYSHPLYQTAVDSGLALNVIEEFFPNNSAGKIPVVGNIFEASDVTFTMFSQGSRMDLFENYINMYKTTMKQDPSKETLKSLARYVNVISGRGQLGTFEPSSKVLNEIFFSARYQAAHIQSFTDMFMAKDPFVKKLAQANKARELTGALFLMATYSVFGDVGTDPRESTFGKARIPGTKKWIDLTAGQSQYFVLIGKMFAQTQKKLGYKEDDAWDIYVNFIEGKFAPLPRATINILKKRNFKGEKPTALSTIRDLMVPISIDNAIDNLEDGGGISESIQDTETMMNLGLELFFDGSGMNVSAPNSKREGSYWGLGDLMNL